MLLGTGGKKTGQFLPDTGLSSPPKLPARHQDDSPSQNSLWNGRCSFPDRHLPLRICQSPFLPIDAGAVFALRACASHRQDHIRLGKKLHHLRDSLLWTSAPVNNVASHRSRYSPQSQCSAVQPPSSAVAEVTLTMQLWLQYYPRPSAVNTFEDRLGFLCSLQMQNSLIGAKHLYVCMYDMVLRLHYLCGGVGQRGRGSGCLVFGGRA